MGKDKAKNDPDDDDWINAVVQHKSNFPFVMTHDVTDYWSKVFFFLSFRVYENMLGRLKVKQLQKK